MAALERERNDLVAVEADLRAQRDAAKTSARRMESLADFQPGTEPATNWRGQVRRAEPARYRTHSEAARRAADNTTGFAATPEGQIIAAEFTANWPALPVAEVLVGRFGTHPTRACPASSNGVASTCPSAETPVAIFSGRVSNVITIPGGGLVVMVDHGSHRSVYATPARWWTTCAPAKVGTVIDSDGLRAYLEIWDAKGMPTPPNGSRDETGSDRQSELRKTSLFNQLTGARAKVANLPGVTVAPTTAPIKGHPDIELIDLPGTYSLHPKALDEAVTRDALLDPGQRPDGLLLVLDSANIKRNLYLALQVMDLGLPTLMVVNETATTLWSRPALESAFGAEVFPVHALNGRGTKALRERLMSWSSAPPVSQPEPTPASWRDRVDFGTLQAALPDAPGAALELLVTSDSEPDWLASAAREALLQARAATGCGTAELQLAEAAHRSQQVRRIATDVLEQNPPASRSLSSRLDKVLTHRIGGPLILMAVFFLMFQAVYAWATWPMDLIDAGMGALMDGVRNALPAGWAANLLVDGLLAGIGGVVIFVPQIALLFGAVAALEESGYMTRVAFMNDRWLRSLGLDGRATIPLLGGFACAVPAILSARTIPGKRERLLTILITPWTCSRAFRSTSS